MKKINLKKLKQIGEKATQGPWFAYPQSGNIRQEVREEDGGQPFILYTEPRSWWENNNDVTFTAEARNNWEAMIEALKEAKTLISSYRQATYHIHSDSKFPAIQEARKCEKWLERLDDEDKEVLKGMI